VALVLVRPDAVADVRWLRDSQLILVYRVKSNWLVPGLTIVSAASAGTFALLILALAPLGRRDIALYVFLTPGVAGVFACIAGGALANAVWLCNVRWGRDKSEK
jgi:hypothetical protein